MKCQEPYTFSLLGKCQKNQDDAVFIQLLRVPGPQHRADPWLNKLKSTHGKNPSGLGFHIPDKARDEFI